MRPTRPICGTCLPCFPNGGADRVAHLSGVVVSEVTASIGTGNAGGLAQERAALWAAHRRQLPPERWIRTTSDEACAVRIVPTAALPAKEWCVLSATTAHSISYTTLIEGNHI